MDRCRYWLRQNKQPEGGQYYNYNFQEALDSIKVYHSDTAKVDQDAMIQELQKPGSQSKLRVLMTTEALALGMDLRDIIQFVIYRFPKNLEPATLWQRGGRACRLGQNGKIIVLTEQWIKGHRKKLPTRVDTAKTTKDFHQWTQMMNLKRVPRGKRVAVRPWKNDEPSCQNSGIALPTNLENALGNNFWITLMSRKS